MTDRKTIFLRVSETNMFGFRFENVQPHTHVKRKHPEQLLLCVHMKCSTSLSVTSLLLP